MKITEPGYYWYEEEPGNLTIIKVTRQRVIFTTDEWELYGWFFGNEVEISIETLEKEGTFLRKVEDYV